MCQGGQVAPKVPREFLYTLLFPATRGIQVQLDCFERCVSGDFLHDSQILARRPPGFLASFAEVRLRKLIPQELDSELRHIFGLPPC